MFIIQGYIKELQFVEKELKDEFILMEKYLKFMAMRESLKSSWKHVLLNNYAWISNFCIKISVSILQHF